MVGDEIWDQQSRIRLKLGPLTEEQYLDFLPGGAAYEPLRATGAVLLRRRYGDRGATDSEARGSAALQIGRRWFGGPRLGWFTWMKSGPDFDRAPADTVLLLA